MCLSALFNTIYTRASTSDITTLPVIRPNIIVQEIGYSENSTLSSLRELFQVAIKIPVNSSPGK